MASLREQFLNASEVVRKKLQVPFQVRKDKKKLESWLIDLESDIADLEFKIKQLKSAEDFDPAGILDRQDDVEIAKRRLKQGEALLEEMFNENAPTLVKEE